MKIGMEEFSLSEMLLQLDREDENYAIEISEIKQIQKRLVKCIKSSKEIKKNGDGTIF